VILIKNKMARPKKFPTKTVRIRKVNLNQKGGKNKWYM